MTDFTIFHDGFFDGILIPEKSRALLFLRTRRGEKWTLFLAGVAQLKLWDFREGNIIFDITVRRGAQIAIADVYELHGFKDAEAAGEWGEKISERIYRQNLVLLQISSSYGAQCMALCESEELKQEKFRENLHK